MLVHLIHHVFRKSTFVRFAKLKNSRDFLASFYQLVSCVLTVVLLKVILFLRVHFDFAELRPRHLIQTLYEHLEIRVELLYYLVFGFIEM